MWGAIDAAITRDEDGFAAGLVEFAHSCGAHARADHQIFVDLFRNGRIPGLWPSRAVRPGTTNSRPGGNRGAAIALPPGNNSARCFLKTLWWAPSAAG